MILYEYNTSLWVFTERKIFQKYILFNKMSNLIKSVKYFQIIRSNKAKNIWI